MFGPVASALCLGEMFQSPLLRGRWDRSPIGRISDIL